MQEHVRPLVNNGEQEEQKRDLVAYGTQVVLDGRLPADPERLASLRVAEGFVRETLARLENGAQQTVETLEVDDPRDQGVSAAARTGESGVMVHTFSAVGRVTMRLVSSRSVPVDEVRRAFVETFGVGRHQTHTTARFRTMAVPREVLATQLAGERDYARVRLTHAPKL